MCDESLLRRAYARLETITDEMTRVIAEEATPGATVRPPDLDLDEILLFLDMALSSDLLPEPSDPKLKLYSHMTMAFAIVMLATDYYCALIQCLRWHKPTRAQFARFDEFQKKHGTFIIFGAGALMCVPSTENCPMFFCLVERIRYPDFRESVDRVFAAQFYSTIPIHWA